MTAAEVMEKYGVSKSALYGSIGRRVRVLRLPGSSMKFNRDDLDALCRQHTTVPAPVPVVAYQQHGRRGQPRPAVQRPRFLSLMS
jgi:hypothetical protein